MHVKLWVRDVVSVALWLLGLPLRPWRRQGVRILLYHTIAQIDPQQDPWRLSVSPQQFRAHLRSLCRWGYRVVSLAEVLEMVRGERPVPFRAVAITFDDGFRDTWTQAYPLLQEFQAPATVFVVPGYLSAAEPFPWLDHPAVFERPLSWEELSQLGANYHIAIGSHSWTHRRLSELSAEEQHQEIERSKRVMEARLGKPVTWFAYPYGGHDSFSEETITWLKQLGFEAACANILGLNYPGDSLWTLKRTRVGWEDTCWRFWLKLVGVYDWVDAWRSPKRLGGGDGALREAEHRH